MDLTWALVRMPPLKLFGVDLFHSEKQRVPGWSGFNAVVLSCVPVLTKHRGLSHDRWLSNRVLAKECHRVMHILPECVHSAELYWGAIDFFRKKDQCCGVGYPVTVNSVFILSLLSAATYSNTQVEMFDGNTTPIISLLAMISFAVLVSIASISS